MLAAAGGVQGLAAVVQGAGGQEGCVPGPGQGPELDGDVAEEGQCRSWSRGVAIGEPLCTGRGTPSTVPDPREGALRGGEEGWPRSLWGRLGLAGTTSLSPGRAARQGLGSRAGVVRAGRRLRH